jgi:hypothetical protein
LCPCARYDDHLWVMTKTSPNPPTMLSDPGWLRSIDRFIERVSRIADSHMKRKPRRMDRKALPKSA